MELRVYCINLFFAFLCLSVSTQCEARVSKHRHLSNPGVSITKHIEMDEPASTFSSTQPSVGSPFTLPPFDSLAPLPLPENTSPLCDDPPSTPPPPSTFIPSPIPDTTSPPPPPQPVDSYSTPNLPIQNPPPSPVFNEPSPPESSSIPNPPMYGPSPPESSSIPSPPEYGPSPPSFTPGTPEYTFSPPSPSSIVPGTPEYVPSPPDYYVPSPPETVPGTPEYGPSPPTYFPSPSGYTSSPPSPSLFMPSPATVFQPPVIYPPPAVPPPPHRGPHLTLWCVVKPSVPDPIIEEAMSYACGSGADCGSIQQDGSCYKPDTLFAHASYAFNSYWQRTKAAGGTCDFGGTGMLVTVDPSFDGCHFIYY